VEPASDVGYAYRGQHSPSSGTVTSVMTPLLEKTDHVLASWGFSRGNTMQSKQAEGASTSQAEASSRTGDPDVDASNSVTSAVTPLLEKTDNYLATWGLTTSASNPKSEDGAAVQVSCATVYVKCIPQVSSVCQTFCSVFLCMISTFCGRALTGITTIYCGDLMPPCGRRPLIGLQSICLHRM